MRHDTGYNGSVILLVDDDDNAPNMRGVYTATLDALVGPAGYDVWDTANSDTEPITDDLSASLVVIWFTGDEFGGFAGPGPAAEAALGAWLDAGGCLFISSQDYHFDRGLTPFMDAYLGITSVTNDNGNSTAVTGLGPVFGGLGPYALAYPFADYSDSIVVDAEADLAIEGNDGNDTAVSKAAGNYKATYWAFPWEAIMDPAGRLATMQAFLDWCGTRPVYLPAIHHAPAD